ncbi:hypothetical protein HYC85_010964 [Camellia sinensis]|uniref:Response regulatory domain-containing protein n=1 Tax=Camellia sinensis TaxID=4442 RepID=A0A7J7HJE7_CAMSI|nr:hypothetical protein HYC85_010964 [Camellia sinensis]
MLDMDGFKLLEHVGLEMDLLVIMMSVDRETSKVMRGVQHGACDYLLKPIRMKELRHIWQHVFRKRIHEVRDIEGHEGKHDNKDFVDPSSVKKARVVWTVDLHQKFVKAVNQIGFDRVSPKKILDLMNIPWLTRENVASHLQGLAGFECWSGVGYRRKTGLKASFGGVKQLDLSSRDAAASLGL